MYNYPWKASFSRYFSRFSLSFWSFIRSSRLRFTRSRAMSILIIAKKTMPSKRLRPSSKRSRSNESWTSWEKNGPYWIGLLPRNKRKEKIGSKMGIEGWMWTDIQSSFSIPISNLCFYFRPVEFINRRRHGVHSTPTWRISRIGYPEPNRHWLTCRAKSTIALKGKRNWKSSSPKWPPVISNIRIEANHS